MQNLLLHQLERHSLELAIDFIDALPEDKLVKKRLSFITVEIIQNIFNHSDRDGLENTLSYYTLQQVDGAWIIQSGNFINRHNLESLLDKLSKISNLDESDINNKIMSSLHQDKFSKKGGAGIGLLSIKKRASSFTWQVEPLEQGAIIHFTICLER